MAPYNAMQRAAIAEFMAFTKCDKTTAAKIVRTHNWNAQAAVAAYYSDATPTPNLSAPELSKVFDQYRDDTQGNPDTIGMDGTQRYCHDIGVSVEDVTFLILSEIVGSDTMGEMKREGFLSGWAQCGAPSVNKQAAFIKRRAAEISTPEQRATLKRVYRHTFKLFLQAPARSLDIDTSIALWNVLFSPQGLLWTTPAPDDSGDVTDWLSIWAEYLRTKSKRPVNKDVWDQIFVFAEKTAENGGVGFWSEHGAWPSVIDEFVEWIKVARPDLDLEKSTDRMEVE